MIPDDDIEDGEEIFEPYEEDGQDIYERLQEAREADDAWINRVDSRGYAPADFLYDPIRDKGRGFE